MIDRGAVVYAALCPEGQEKKAAWHLLALAVKGEYGLDILPQVAREPGGKPYFPDAPHICFNLSHSHGAAVCALHHRPVGIDVEKLRPAPRRLAGGARDDEFFRRWTGREASIKLEGRGWQALVEDREPDRRCCWLEELLPGWIIALCPEQESPIRCVRIGTDELALD